jgi:hypothetical protein
MLSENFKKLTLCLAAAALFAVPALVLTQDAHATDGENINDCQTVPPESAQNPNEKLELTETLADLARDMELLDTNEELELTETLADLARDMEILEKYIKFYTEKQLVLQQNATKQRAIIAYLGDKTAEPALTEYTRNLINELIQAKTLEPDPETVEALARKTVETIVDGCLAEMLANHNSTEAVQNDEIQPMESMSSEPNLSDFSSND